MLDIFGRIKKMFTFAATKQKTMYIITHNVDNVKSTILPTDTHLVSFVRKIAIENEDDHNLITSIIMAKDYLKNCCPNLTLTTAESTVLHVTNCKTCPFAERLDEEQLGDGQYICNEIHRQKIEWIDKDGFDELYHNDIIPKACPLKKSTVTISLQ